jgi:RNA polymerase sigma-70 factor, ECF subfamily
MAAEINPESRTVTTLELAPVLSNDDDVMLIAQARSGSPAAIEHLVDRYESRLFRLVQNITGNHEDAEEVVQNAFVKAFRKLDTFRGDSRFYTWLVRIAMNESLMKIRGKRFKEVPIDGAKDEEDGIGTRELEDWGPNPEERYSQEELRRILAMTISELAPRYRTVFQLRDVEGLSTDETARMLGLSCSAVKTRLRRARFRLRDSLDVCFRPPKSAGDIQARGEPFVVNYSTNV